MHLSNPPLNIHSAARLASSKQRGYSMLELLIAMGIFAIGFVAVASIFPVAATMQRRTAHDIEGKNTAVAARAIINTESLDGEEVVGDWEQGYVVRTDQWPRDARLHPTMYEKSDRNRSYEWVPLLRFSETRNKMLVSIFVMRRDLQGNIPPIQDVAIDSIDPRGIFTVSGTPDIQVGDQVLDSNGYLHTVKATDGSNIVVDGFITQDVAPYNISNGGWPTRLWHVRHRPQDPGSVVATTAFLKEPPTRKCYWIIDAQSTGGMAPPPRAFPADQSKANCAGSGSVGLDFNQDPNDPTSPHSAGRSGSSVKIEDVGPAAEPMLSEPAAEWLFTNVPSGQYTIGVTWDNSGLSVNDISRDQSTFRVLVDGAQVHMANEDQSVNPVAPDPPLVPDAATFKKLTNVTIPAGGATIQVWTYNWDMVAIPPARLVRANGNPGGGGVIADAVVLIKEQ